MPQTHNSVTQRGRWYALVATMTRPGSPFSRSKRQIARTDDHVSVPFSSKRIRSAGTPESCNSRAMTEASDGPCRPTPPVGINRTSGWPSAHAIAASTRRLRVKLGFPSARTAAPNITIVIIPAICCQITHRKQSGRRYNKEVLCGAALGVGLVQGIGLNPRGTHMRFVSTRWSFSAAGLISALALAACSQPPPPPPPAPAPPPVVMTAPPPAPVVTHKWHKHSKAWYKHHHVHYHTHVHYHVHHHVTTQ